MNLKQERDAVLAAARQIIDAAKASGRELTSTEAAAVTGKLGEARKLTSDIESELAGDTVRKAFGQLTAEGGHVLEGAKSASWGDHFVKTCGAQLVAMKGVSGATVSSPEFKAGTDTQITGNGVFTPFVTEYDRTVIQAVRPRLVVADLIGSGSISGTAISYFIEGLFEGAFGMVAEGGAKPQVHVVDPTVVTDSVRKIAAFIKFTDEMLEDLDFVVSEINSRLPYELAKKEEVQILSGDATGQNLDGILHRSGIQTEARGTVLSGDTVADTIFRAITKVSVVGGLDADGIMIHPTDYQALRLSKDSNAQYYGGGFFQGQYGNGGTITDYPPIWGLRTVVTPAVSVGTAVVGAFKQAATLYRKGGVRIESTNSHATDFTSNLVTTRVEERLALAVRRPLGIVKVTVSAAP